MTKKISVTLYLFFIATNLFAQSKSDFIVTLNEAKSTDREVRIELKNDSNIYIGKVESVTNEKVVIQSTSSSFTFEIESIKSVTLIDPNNKETLWYKNESRNRLFVSQTALNNGAGSGYYQNIFIFLSNISYSPTNFLTINAGFSNVPQLTINGDFFLLGAKLNTKAINNFHLGISGTLYSIANEQVGFVNFLGTYSNKRLDLNMGLGYGISEGDNSSPLFIFGFQYRASERLSWVSENFSLPGVDDNLISFGPRFLGKKIATDLGFFFLPGEVESAIPFVSFTVAF